ASGSHSGLCCYDNRRVSETAGSRERELYPSCSWIIWMPDRPGGQTCYPAREGWRFGMDRASGTFEVKLAPQKPDNPQAEAAALGRMSLDKQFHGDLEATGQGEMLS